MIRSKKAKYLGWGLSCLLAALLILGSASGKFLDFEGKEEMFGQLGWSTDTMFVVGIVEVIIAILFLIPRSATIAAILLTGYLGGATAAHVRIGEPFVVPIVVGIVVWIALGLRDPRIFHVLFFRPTPAGGFTTSETPSHRD